MQINKNRQGKEAMAANETIETFLDGLASSAPTPGGGGAAAISGAMGAALVSMVCNLTIGKKKYVEVEADLKQVLEKSEALRKTLTGMIADDVEAFDAVMGAYGLPKTTDEEKAARAAKIQEVLNQKLIEEMAQKPRNAFGPLRTAISGKRISPPLFESMEILGKAETLARLSLFARGL